MKNIATTSVAEGLDFAFNLMVGPAADGGRDDGALAQTLLSLIENFVHARYAGELEISLGFLEAMDDCVPAKHRRNREQLDAQMAWLRERLPGSHG